MSFSVTTPLGSYSLLSEDEVSSDDHSLVFITTSLHAHFVFKVRRFETIAEVKERLVILLQSAYPSYGEVKILAVKFKRQGQLCLLEDSECMRTILDETKGDRLCLYMDTSSSGEHHELNNSQGWSTDEDSQGALGEEESDKEENNLQNYPDGRVDIAASAKETSPEELPKNPLIAPEQTSGAQQSVSEQGDNMGEFTGDEEAI